MLLILENEKYFYGGEMIVLFLLIMLLIPDDTYAVRPVWILQGMSIATKEVCNDIYSNKYIFELKNSIIDFEQQTDDLIKAKAKITVISNFRKCLAQYYLHGGKNKKYLNFLKKVYHHIVSKKFQNWEIVLALSKKYVNKVGAKECKRKR